MKKSFISFSLISLTLAFILCLTSCFNFFSRGNDDDDQPTATFTGYINIDSRIGSDFVISDSPVRTASPAPITITEGGTYQYSITALRLEDENGHTDGTTTASPDSIDISTRSFEIGLLYGKWKV